MSSLFWLLFRTTDFFFFLTIAIYCEVKWLCSKKTNELKYYHSKSTFGIFKCPIWFRRVGSLCVHSNALQFVLQKQRFVPTSLTISWRSRALASDPYFIKAVFFKLHESWNQFSQSRLALNNNRIDYKSLLGGGISLFKCTFPRSGTVYIIVTFESCGILILKWHSSVKWCEKSLDNS